MASWHDGSVPSCGSYRDQPYLYEPITQRSEMRLLKIQPGEENDPIRGELVIISTNSQQDYDAVSYTWADQTGDATRRFRAFIGSGYVPITCSCHEALKRIRSRFYTKCVWIDSLCVDQDNVQERGHQVQLMPRIYTRARKTYVYVGPTTSKDESILEALATGKVEHGCDDDKQLFWVTLNSFLRRPYFFRVWVIQEIALSANPVILCADKEFPWSVFQHATASWKYRVSPLLSLGKRRLRYSADLPDLLRLGRTCQSTDPRDRVFALLGLVADAEAEGLVADYRRSTPEIFTWIARYLVKVGTAVEVLGNVDMYLDSEGSECLLGFRNQLQLPSWVPDWTNAETTFLDVFPEARTYLESLTMRLDELDMRALILTGFEIRCIHEHWTLDRLSQEGYWAAMFVRPYEQLRRVVLFQGEQETPWRYLPEYLIMLAPGMMERDGDSEVPGWKDDDDLTIYENDEGDSTFRFLGLLSVTPHLGGSMVRHEIPHGYRRSDLVSIKLV